MQLLNSAHSNFPFRKLNATDCVSPCVSVCVCLCVFVSVFDCLFLLCSHRCLAVFAALLAKSLRCAAREAQSSAETNSLSFILALARDTHTRAHTYTMAQAQSTKPTHTHTHIHTHTPHTLLHTGTHRTRSTSRLDFIFDSHHLTLPGHPFPHSGSVCVCLKGFSMPALSKFLQGAGGAGEVGGSGAHDLHLTQFRGTQKTFTATQTLKIRPKQTTLHPPPHSTPSPERTAKKTKMYFDIC